MTGQEYAARVKGLRYLASTPSQEGGYADGRVHLFEDGWAEGIKLKAALRPESAARREELMGMRKPLLQLATTGLPMDVVEADRNDPPIEVWFADRAEELTGFSISPEMRDLLDSLSGELTTIVMHFKRQGMEARPYQYFDALGWTDVPRFPSESGRSPAYPSGHAVITRFLARVLSLLNPSGTEIYGRLAEDVSRGRVMAGWHFPSDIEGGYQLADALWPYLSEGVRQWVKGQRAARPEKA